MTKNDKDIIDYINSIEFYRDIEDNIWYTRDYQQRISPAYYNKHNFNIYYGSAGFNNGIYFNTINELKKLIK
jgi:hypothetical protein